MKKLLFILLFFIQVNSLFSQINKENIAFELRYPISIGDNFLNNYKNGYDYTGLVDLGVDYNVFKKNNLGVGILLNSSFLNMRKNNVHLMILSPKIKVDYKIDIKKISIIPQIAFGYSDFRFSCSDVELVDEFGLSTGKEYKTSQNGITFKAGTKVVLNSSNRLNWYAQIAYEYTKLQKPVEGAVYSDFNQKVKILYPGVGVIWKFN